MTEYGPRTLAADSLHAMKYRGQGEDFREAMNRVAFGLKDSDSHYHELRQILLHQRFCPGGRIQGAIGSSKAVTSYNCFVSGTIADSFVDGPGSIMTRAHEAAATMRMGGGIGYNFSTLRPRGDLIAKLQSQSSGPISFMHIFDAICLATSSSGHRRGAQMGVLRCLAGSTMVHTLQGLVPIKELEGRRPYVYSCDGNKVRIVRANKVFVSGHNRSIVRVLFDNMQWIDCTPDHLFMLKDGSYKEAALLERGTSLMAIEHSINNHGNSVRYVRTVGCTGGRAEYEHRIVARDIKGESVSAEYHGHHLDGDACNNDPDNIEMISRSEHAKAHDSNLEIQRQRIAAERKGKTRAELYGEEKAREWELKRQKSRGFDPNTTISVEETNSYVEDLLGDIGNHRVVSVTSIGYADEVYDINLPAFHNFAANGVFVHNCDHPDVEEFVRAKQNDTSLRGFNISLAITDEFMEAVLREEEFNLRFNGRTYRTVNAAELWEKIMRSTWDYAEPGVLFIDTIDRMNNLWYCETLAASNPCGEQPLPPHGACLLGSFNLVKYLRPRLASPGGALYSLDYDQLEEDIPAIVRGMDNVVDRSKYPLAEQRAEALSKRRMGLGVMGLANALEACGHAYGTQDFIDVESYVLEKIKHGCYEASADLAKEKGPFPLFDAERYLKGQFVKTLPDHIKTKIGISGMRNSHLTSIAPTGTISLCADNVSGGLEPVFSYTTERTIHTPSGPITAQVEDYGAAFLQTRGKLAKDVTAAEHIAVLSTAQRHIDSAVSKTVNMTSAMPWQDFKNVYRQAWELGCKGCATFNSDGKRGALLVAKDENTSDEVSCLMVDPTTGQRDCG